MKNISYPILIILCCLFTACSKAKTETPQWEANHVVLIGIDGWTVRSLEKADMPHVKQLMQNGAYTLKKRSVLPSSSAVNWATMFMGSGPELHGFTTWGSKTPEVEPREVTHYGLYPSIWGLFRDQYPNAEIGYFYQWDGFKHFAELEAMSTESHGKVEEGSEMGADEYTTVNAINYIRDMKPNLVGVFLDEPDHTGHTFGFDSPEYIDKLNELDIFVGRIVQSVKDAGIYDETIFIVTSDHGGIEKNHGGKTMEEMETVLIYNGKNIKKGHPITESIMQYDIAPTIAHILKVDQPQVWIGRPMKQVFNK